MQQHWSAQKRRVLGANEGHVAPRELTVGAHLIYEEAVDVVGRSAGVPGTLGRVYSRRSLVPRCARSQEAVFACSARGACVHLWKSSCFLPVPVWKGRHASRGGQGSCIGPNCVFRSGARMDLWACGSTSWGGGVSPERYSGQTVFMTILSGDRGHVGKRKPSVDQCQ